jgi:hypothetical protein
VLGERVYTDSWGLRASTTDVRFIVDVGPRVDVWATLRGHVQSGVGFWERAYAGTFSPTVSVPRYRTGDRELGPLHTGTLGVATRWDIGSTSRPDAWSLVGQVDLMATRFPDTLFVQSRQASLSIVQLEAAF